MTADAFVAPSTEAESVSVIVAFDDPPLAVETFTFVVVELGIDVPPLVTAAHDPLTEFVVFGAGPNWMCDKNVSWD